jgi:hypothetical protein
MLLRRAYARAAAPASTDRDVLPFVRNLLSRWDARDAGSPPEQPSRRVSDTLTARERAVLAMISQQAHRSNPGNLTGDGEIARQAQLFRSSSSARAPSRCLGPDRLGCCAARARRSPTRGGAPQVRCDDNLWVRAIHRQVGQNGLLRPILRQRGLKIVLQYYLPKAEVEQTPLHRKRSALHGLCTPLPCEESAGGAS